VISVSPRARRGASCPDCLPVTQGAHHPATPVCTAPTRPRRLLLSHAPVASRPSRPRHRLTRLISRPAAKPHLSPHRPYAPTPHPRPPRTARPPCPRAVQPSQPRPHRPGQAPHPPQPSRPTPTRANPNANQVLAKCKPSATPQIRGKPFLAAGNGPADYSELPTTRTSPERIEGVSRSLPYSDLLTLTSSHMFFSVMN
jgi:hypothetical protein